MLLNITILTLVSFLSTIAIDKSIVLKLCKNYMDKGYNLNSFNEQIIFDDIMYIPLLVTILPIYNIICRLYILKYVNMYHNNIFEKLKENNLISEMDIEKVREYKKNPNIFNAFKVNYNIIKENEKNAQAQKIILTINKEEAEIEYKINNLTGDLEITMLKGPINIIMDDKEAKKVVQNSWFLLLMSMEKIYKNQYVLVKELKNNNYYSMSVDENNMNIEKIEFYYNPKQLTKVLRYYNKPSKNSRD